MKPAILHGLLAVGLCAATAHAADLTKIVLPPPEAPGLARQAQAELDAAIKRTPQLDTAGLLKQLEIRPDTLIIDVRTPAEIAWFGGRIDAPRFANVERGFLEMQIEQNAPAKDQAIVVYCGVSQRSAFAADTLKKLGYTQVFNYRDGFFNWKRAGLPVVETDAAPDSFLYRRPVEVVPGVWSAIGATAPGTYENSGHNNNLSFVVSDDGVLVVNAGDNYLLAQSLHDEIRRITPQPVKYVVLENSQGHAMLGSNYWREQGAKIIAHRDTASAIADSGHEALATMRNRAHDKAYRTELVSPDIVYDDTLDLKLGGQAIRILHLGPSHSHGDTMVWLPQRKLVIAGDTAFHVRMLPIFEGVDTAAWIATWDKFEALGAITVIPGHGGPTDMPTVRRWTRDYLVHLRTEIKKVLDAGGSLDDAYDIDQSAYLHLHTADELARSNAGRVFREMEFE